MDIRTYYTLIFNLAQHHKWSVSEIENMYPFERDIYVDLLNAHLQELKKEQEKNG